MRRASMFEVQRPLRAAERIGQVDPVVVALVVLLSAVGVVTLYSAAGGALEPWAWRHGLRALGGLVVLVACAVVPVSAWKRAAVPAYVIALGLLLLVPVVGTESMGAKRWLMVGGASLQPSEVMKVALVLVLARYFCEVRSADIGRLAVLALPLVLIAVPVALTIKQPDLGTAVLLSAIGLGLMFLAGAPLAYFAGGAVAVALAVPHALGHLRDYQRRRIDVFLDPGSAPLGAGYHITQAKIAIASGGFDGQGYLKGTHSQLDFVPEKMTDFIFAMIGEEWGFVGAMVLLGLVAALTARLLASAGGCRDAFGRLVVCGAALMLSVYALINMAMVTGLVPVVGVPLPFVSYGGTSLLTLMVALGIAMSAVVEAGRR